MMRFNPDGECLPVALDYVTDFLRQKKYEKKVIKKIKNLAGILNFLSSEKFNFFVYTPAISFLSPIRLWVLFSYLRYFISLKAFKQRKEKLKTIECAYAVLYLATPKQLYGIKNEEWSHYIACHSNGGKFSIIDPLKHILEKEFLDLKPVSNENELDNLFGVKILIW